jgi:hypothetical protein
MTTTHVSEIYDLFMQLVSDYRLIELFNSSVTDFENYLQAWLEYSINDFSICNQDLAFDSTTKLFGVTLTTQNKIILATLMMKWWLNKSVNDITQFNLHIVDRDFKVFSEAQNLREKCSFEYNKRAVLSNVGGLRICKKRLGQMV